MATNTKCPSCDAELNIKDDPMLLELKQSVDKLIAENAKLRDKLEAAGVAAPKTTVPAAAQRASVDAGRRFHTLLDDDDEPADGQD